MRLRMTISFMLMLKSEVVIIRGGSVVTDWSVVVEDEDVLQQGQGVEETIVNHSYY